MPRKTSLKRLEANKRWLAKKKAEDPEWAAKRQQRQNEYWREKRDNDPVWVEKERERQRKAKRDQRTDPLRGDKLREAERARHKKRITSDPNYRETKRDQSRAKYWRDKVNAPLRFRLRGLRKRCLDHGISIDIYDQMWEEQHGVCKICKRPETRESRGTLCCLSIDHCHETGKVRGLLCDACNTGIGRLDDNVERLQAAIQYLEES